MAKSRRPMGERPGLGLKPGKRLAQGRRLKVKIDKDIASPGFDANRIEAEVRRSQVHTQR